MTRKELSKVVDDAIAEIKSIILSNQKHRMYDECSLIEYNLLKRKKVHLEGFAGYDVIDGYMIGLYYDADNGGILAEVSRSRSGERVEEDYITSPLNVLEIHDKLKKMSVVA